MIKVSNLVKSFDSNSTAVKNVSFEVQRGEIVGLLGPNGAGKTTIMRMLTTYLTPTSGDIFIDGKDVLEESLYIKNLIGYLPEHTPQYDDMTVYDYLKFCAEIRGIEKENVDSSIKKMVELVSLKSVIVKKIGQLSKGFRKRVGLASVMLHDPQILILDEPTSGLDPNQIITFRRMLRRLSEKKTIILSTHILSEIEALCERVIIIKKGQVVADDSLQKLVEKFADEKFFDLTIEADNLNDLEQKLTEIKSAWKIEFEKKLSKNAFKFKAMVGKDANFTNEINEFVNKYNYKLSSISSGSANLEEIFLKLAGEGDENENA